MPIPKMTKNQFKKWRREMGLSQHEAAEVLGYKHKGAISHIESGHTAIGPRLVIACRYLKIMKFTKEKNHVA